ncbi:MAG: hypothetical protein R3A44_20755 [Caldilineaceae bacterium]
MAETSGFLSSFIWSPPLILGALLSIFYASLYHVWGGHGLRDLIIYLIAAGCGLALGQGACAIMQLGLFEIGHLCVVEASIGAWLALFIVRLFV